MKRRCQKGEKEREDGEAMTQEIEWGRESAVDRSGDTDGVGGVRGEVGTAQLAMRATAAWALK